MIYIVFDLYNAEISDYLFVFSFIVLCCANLYFLIKSFTKPPYFKKGIISLWYLEKQKKLEIKIKQLENELKND